ncbi:hypothetical protein PENSTE_c001G06802 [Penicillium steckii]|uniref:Uncharacterized protein n=1 Tax=Penicillium steckii TaxID=303698 RepID=A0A1V6U0Y5_9EURO|nr:hypothetical protein PENSTE_c001G06802 [Penicillium steckii]
MGSSAHTSQVPAPDDEKLAEKEDVSLVESAGKMVDAANKFGIFLYWIAGVIAGVFFFGARKVFRKCTQRQNGRQAREAEESGIALTTLDLDGNPRTVQFCVQNWEQERRNIQRAMDDIREIRELQTEIQNALNSRMDRIEGRVLRPRGTR